MSYTTWVLAYDFDASSDAALAFVEAEAKARGVERIQLVHAFALREQLEAIGDAELRRIRTAVEDRVRDVVQPALDRVARVDGIEVHREVVLGAPSRVLSGIAARQDALIVSGLSTGSLERALPGHRAQRLLRAASSPVLLIPEGWASKPLVSTLAAVDLSAASRRVLHATVRLFGAENLSVVSLIDPDPFELMQDILLRRTETEAQRGQAIARLLDDVGLSGAPTHVFEKAPSGSAILEVADLLDVDALAMGTYGHGAIHRAFLGSAAGRVLAETRRPTLFVPAHEADPDWL